MTTALLAGTVRTRLEHVWSTVVTLDVRDEHATVAAVVDVRDAAIATSGVSQRGEHVLDPRTREPARGARQATVVGTDGALADALATALLVEGRDGARWFSALPGWSAYVVDGSITTAWGPAFTTSIPDSGGEER